MARNIGVKMNGEGIGEVLNSSGVRAELTKRAERVLAAAQSSAPVASGAYRDSLHIEQDTTDRAVARVVSGDFKGHILEARYGILARALDAAGGE